LGQAVWLVVLCSFSYSVGVSIPRALWRKHLHAATDRRGSAAANDVIEALGERMKDAFKARDLDLLKMGEVRWRNRARFARLRMREQGLLSQTSHRGLWEITDAGRRYLAGG
jgi:restriction endonuclease Mrr